MTLHNLIIILKFEMKCFWKIYLFLLISSLKLSYKFANAEAGFGNPFYLQFPHGQYNQLQYNGLGQGSQFSPWLQNFQLGQNITGQNQIRTINNPTNFPQFNGNINPNIFINRNQQQGINQFQQQSINVPFQQQSINIPFQQNGIINSQIQQHQLPNGTILYYLSNPFGGINPVAPVNRNVDNTLTTTTPQNWAQSQFTTNPFIATTSQNFNFQNNGQHLNREQQTQAPQAQNLQNLDPWHQHNFGWGWSPYYNNGPLLTTINPIGTTGSSDDGSTTGYPPSRERPSTTEGSTTPSTTTTEGSNTTSSTSNSTSSGDSVAKFRRIVTQIRDIARKELRA